MNNNQNIKVKGMLLTIIKIITLLYPFLNELFLGKHSHRSKKRNTKRLFIFIFLISITVNMYGGKRMMTYVKEMKDLTKENRLLIVDNKKLTDSKNKVQYVNVEKEVIKTVAGVCKPKESIKVVYRDRPIKEIDPTVKQFIDTEMEKLSKLEE